MPIQQLTKSTNGKGLVESKASAEAEALGKSVNGESGEAKSNFSALFAQLIGTDSKKSSEIKSENGATLKNLLEEKTSDKVTDKKKGKDGDSEDVETSKGIDPKISQELLTKGQLLKKEELNTLMSGQKSLGPQVASTNNKIYQLLNNLKDTHETSDLDSVEAEEINGKNEPLLNEGLPRIKGNSVKEGTQLESPLDFLMKGTKEKGVSEKIDSEMTPKNNVDSDSKLKKVMTADDFLSNKQSSEKKVSNLSLHNGKNDIEVANNSLKTILANAKNYGQGMNLLSDPMIKNTRDLSSKVENKEKKLDLSINELQSKEMRAVENIANSKQDIVIGVQHNKENQSQADLQANTNQKVLNLSEIQTTNTSEIIKRISDYIEQSQVANKQSLDLNVKHESLGEFKIQVSKMPESMNRGLNQVDMQITTSSKEGHDFFMKNEVSLIKNLNQAGINLSDLRIVSNMTESTPFGQSDSRQSSSFNQSPDGSSKQFMNLDSNSFGQSTGQGNGAERRKELWEEYQERYGA